MLSNNEVTERLLIVVLSANFVLLLFIAWHVATARHYFRQVHRLAIAIMRTIDCDELINEMLSCSGGTAEKQRYEGTVLSLRTLYPKEGTHNWSEPATAFGVCQGAKLPWKARLGCSGGGEGGGQAGRYGLLAHGKALTASHIEENLTGSHGL